MLGRDPPQDLGDPPPRFVVVEDRQVAEFEAEVVRPDQRGRGPRFLAADRRDRLGVVLGAAAVAGRHRGDRDVAARLPQQDQRAGALKLDIVGMGMQGQNTNRFGASFFLCPQAGFSILRDVMPRLRPRTRPRLIVRNPLRRSSETNVSKFFRKMFSRALANLCTLATKESVTDRPCRALDVQSARVIQLRVPF